MFYKDFRHPEKLEIAKEKIEEAGGLDLIEMLQNHENQKIYETCVSLVESFFPCDDEDSKENDDVNFAADGENMQFQF